MCCKMCATLALCLVFLLGVSEAFFMPVSLRKQAPQSATYNPHWISTQTSGTNPAVNNIQAGYGNPKDFGPYQQQQLQQPQQQFPQQQQQQLQQPQQTLYGTQLQNVQSTAPKYEPTPFQTMSQSQYSYEGIYPAPYNSYSQSVQLVPCLCPVNKEMMEQQNQQFQQQSSMPVAPTATSFPADSNSNVAAAPQPPPPPQTNQKTS